MPVPTRDCDCEDFPCCEHADNFPVEDNPMIYYCDICGYSHVGDCTDDFEDDEGETLETGVTSIDEGGSGAAEYWARREPTADLLEVD